MRHKIYFISNNWWDTQLFFYDMYPARTNMPSSIERAVDILQDECTTLTTEEQFFLNNVQDNGESIQLLIPREVFAIREDSVFFNIDLLLNNLNESVGQERVNKDLHDRAHKILARL